MVLYLFYQLRSFLTLVGLREHDGGFHHLSANLVGHAGDGTLHHGRVRHKRRFHLKRTDAVAARLDYVVFAAYEPVITVFVAPSHVAGVIDSVVVSLVGQLGVAVIFLE